MRDSDRSGEKGRRAHVVRVEEETGRQQVQVRRIVALRCAFSLTSAHFQGRGPAAVHVLL